MRVCVPPFPANLLVARVQIPGRHGLDVVPAAGMQGLQGGEKGLIQLLCSRRAQHMGRHVAPCFCFFH